MLFSEIFAIIKPAETRVHCADSESAVLENLLIRLRYTLEKVVYKRKGKTEKSSNSADFWGRSPLKNMEKLIDSLEDNDDVQNVYHNWDQD